MDRAAFTEELGCAWISPVRGRSVIVTGAASGIGRATARLLVERGARAALADVDPSGAQVAEEIRAGGGEAAFFHHDVTDESSWERLMETVVARWERLDGLVNNAGISAVGPVAEMRLDEWRRVLAVNLDGVFLGTKHALRAMRRTGSQGAIVNVSSASGLVGSPGASAYCASKGGVRLFTKAVALECAKEGIRVNSLHPGAVRTGIWETASWWPGFVAKAGGEEAAWQELASATPLGRLADPEEVAQAILYLLSDDARFMTGSELVIDGGYTAA
jgi:NAD(P)-dependent dehydrogenase (short-subunit alcohol dehydrogenase family)